MRRVSFAFHQYLCIRTRRNPPETKGKIENTIKYLRYRYVEFTTDISTENVIKMHLNAFSFFGGFTDTILYDNMKQVVIDRKIKASKSRFNQKFIDFSEY